MATVEAASLKSEELGAAWDWYEMIQALYQAPLYHLMFEAALIIWIVRLLFFTKSYRLANNSILTQREQDELIEEWRPEPLVPDVPDDQPGLHNLVHRVIDSKIGKFVSINGRECLNVASLNFLSMLGRSDIEEKAVKAVQKYGVGTCGPRGFYGTIDVHLELEEKMAEFVGCEEAILYSYGFATIASAIPAYSKRGDIIFCDDGVNFAIQKGILASRSVVYYFKHNDMEDLERLLQEQEKRDKKNMKKAKATRRFLLVEGLYVNHGDMCPLPKLVELKWKYKVRIFMDESMSFGTLGKSGKGVTEHFGISMDEVDLISVSLENALGSIGGMCIGKAYVIDHQRLSGQGYCFSASLPALNATAALVALNLLKENPSMMVTLESNCKYIHNKLKKIPGLTVYGEEISPIQHLRLQESSGDRTLDYSILQNIVNMAEERGVALAQASYLEKEEMNLPPPSIRIAVSVNLTQEDMDNALSTLEDISRQVIS